MCSTGAPIPRKRRVLDEHGNRVDAEVSGWEAGRHILQKRSRMTLVSFPPCSDMWPIAQLLMQEKTETPFESRFSRRYSNLPPLT